MLNLNLYRDAIVNSYSQIFFSNHKWFGFLLLLASFIDPYVGLGGLIAATSSVFFASWLGFNKESVRAGLYSYNSILVGFTIAVFFKFSFPFFGFLLLASFITVLITVWLSSFTAGYKIPFLSLPFIFGVWIVLLSSRSFQAIELSERGIFNINEVYSFWGDDLAQFMLNISAFKFPLLIDVYLKSLGAIFFQYNLLVGGIIALGLLVYSRIAFSLSILGFLSGYFFCYFLKGNMTEIEYSYIGFNYVLSAIALGGFFLIASWRSYLLVVVSSTVIGICISALGNFMSVFQLPIYSLPFSLVVMLFIYALYNRMYGSELSLVQYQQYSPEKNLYTYFNRLERFKNDTYFHVQLPFYGEWFVSQAHDGKITHKEDWRFAFDFVIVDETQKTFKSPGEQVSDFFCYALPILAPAAGYVVNIVDGIEDNAVGDINIGENWGNAIVIKHSDYLYSKITHIKNATFKFRIGDYVNRGEVLALCGNSGRSPEPHIHFQLQATPYIGAKTLKYPISYYVAKQNGKYSFHSFEYPREGQHISRVLPNYLLSSAFYFVPGMTLSFSLNNAVKSTVQWEAFVDAANQSYLYCSKTNSVAYFINNGTLFYFTEFKGDQSSLLYYFYLGAHKILLSYYQDLEITDVLPIEGFFTGVSKFIQDFSAPFVRYLKTPFKAKFIEIDDVLNPQKIVISTQAAAYSRKKLKRKIDFTLEIKDNKISKIIYTENKKCTEALRIL